MTHFFVSAFLGKSFALLFFTWLAKWKTQKYEMLAKRIALNILDIQAYVRHILVLKFKLGRMKRRFLCFVF
jgi:hypothetical protein